MELLARYSNRQEVLNQLVTVLERIRANDQTDEPGVKSAERPARGSAKLTPEDVRQLVAAFRAGTAKHVLAGRYGISESTVKRLLRLHKGSSSTD